MGRNKSHRRHKASRQSNIATFPLSFGRYEGKPVSAVPRSYLEWMVRQSDAPAADRWIARQFLGGVALR